MMKKIFMIEVTNRCTLRCPTCFSHQDGRQKADLSYANFKKIIDENHDLIESLTLYNYGEPLLNDDLPAMVAYAKSQKIGFIKIATNGMNLTSTRAKELIASGLDYLSISIDGATRKVYEKFRVGGDFKKVVTYTRNLVKLKNMLKSTLKIEIQFIIMRHNEHEIEAIEKLARKLGVNRLRLKTVLVKKDEWQYLLPRNEYYNRYSFNAEEAQCRKPLHEVVINCDGTVIPCCYIVGNDIEKFKIGNVFEQSLGEILDSEKYKAFVRICSTQKRSLSSCRHCPEGNQPLDYKVVDINHGDLQN